MTAPVGRDLTQLASVASLFVSRLDTEIDHRPRRIGSVEAKAVRGRAHPAGVQAYEAVFTSDRWHTLARAGARRQRPL